jgi:hypothetical protein
MLKRIILAIAPILLMFAPFTAEASVHHTYHHHHHYTHHHYTRHHHLHSKRALRWWFATHPQYAHHHHR